MSIWGASQLPLPPSDAEPSPNVPMPESDAPPLLLPAPLPEPLEPELPPPSVKLLEFPDDPQAIATAAAPAKATMTEVLLRMVLPLSLG
jgi:hypothetical protein